LTSPSPRPPAGVFPPGSLLAAYLRDSGGEDQDLSIDQQETALRAWCLENGCVLNIVFRDTRTGTSTVGRAGFEQLIHHFFRKAKAPEAGILLWRFNRFARDLDDAQFFKAGLRRRGYAIYALNDPIPEGPAGRVLEFFIDWMADKFSEDLSVDVRRGQRQLVERFGALGGPPPRGFIRVPVQMPARRDGSTHLVHRWAPDPALWETCRAAWQMRAAGASYRQIHAALHLFGSINSYVTFYRNPIYLGELHFGADLVIPAYVQPLIDRQTWDTVQALNRANTAAVRPNAPRHPRRVASAYPLSGLLHCARCGALMNGHTIQFKNEPERPYYTCSKRHAKRDCDAPLIPAPALEEHITAYLVDHVLTPTAIADHRAQRLNHQAEAHDQAKSERAEVGARLAQARRRLANVTDAIADRGLSPALSAKLRELETEQATLQARITALSQTPIQRQLTPAQIQTYAHNLQTLIRHADTQTRRTILAGLLESIEANRSGRLVTCTLNLYDQPDDRILALSDIPITGPDPPPNFYAYAAQPPGSTTYTHHFSFETKRRS
jgi:site-specific DNA recombinase